MHEDAEFSAIARTVIHRDRIGYRLLTVYYLLAVVVVVASCAVRPAEAGIVIGGGVLIGVVLLTYVSVANRRALRPLEEHWPQLAAVPTRRRDGRQGAPTRPHKGGTGIFYVIALLLVAAAGGLTVSVANASKASATTEVTVLSCNETSRVENCDAQWVADGHSYKGTISWASRPGTQQGRYNPNIPDAVYSASLPYLNGTTVILGVLIVVLGPVCAFICLLYRRQTRGPYLAALQQALSQGQAPPAAVGTDTVPFSWFPDVQHVAAPGTAQPQPRRARHRR